MELMFREARFLVIGLPVLVIAAVLFHFLRYKGHFSHGLIAGNAQLVSTLPEFTSARKRRLIVKIIGEVCIFCFMASLLVLAAGPYTSREEEIGKRQRDIMLCIDSLFHTDGLNQEMYDALIGIVRGMEGDRFGINTYNSSSCLFVPLTDDYDYIISRLEMMRDRLDLGIKIDSYYWEYGSKLSTMPDSVRKQYEEELERYNYIRSQFWEATDIDSGIRGDGIHGDALASTLMAFPAIGEERRTRVIILPTDLWPYENDPYISFEDAVTLCAQRDVVIFPLFRGPEVAENGYYEGSGYFLVNVQTSEEYSDLREEEIVKDCRAQMHAAADQTGGSYHEFLVDGSATEIIDKLKKEEAMQVEVIKEMRDTEHPEIPFLLCFVFFTAGCACALRLRV